VLAGGVHNAAEIEAAMNLFAAKPNGGLIILPHALIGANYQLITALEAKHRFPGVDTIGGLAVYSVDWDKLLESAAGYVDRILRGTSPSELPVQAPTKFILTINLQVAKAIGLEVPASVLLLADEVIE
jgi:putative tryptophan/tyrosine transport system substrate-binding protein